MGLLNVFARAKRSAIEGDRVVPNKDFYVSQGSHPTRCGPAVAVMAARWSGVSGAGCPFNILPWNFGNINNYLNKYGVATKAAANLSFNNEQAAIARINAAGFIPHFVMLTWQGSELVVHDPLSNTRLQTVDEFSAEMKRGYFLVIDHGR